MALTLSYNGKKKALCEQYPVLESFRIAATAALAQWSAACLTANGATTADPKPKDEELSRTEATTDWYDHDRSDFDRGDLRDEGRNPDGSGESYSERNR